MNFLIFTFFLTCIVTPAIADPVSIAVAAMAATSVTAAGAITFSFAAFATTLALTQAAKMLAPKPDEGFQAGVTGYLTSGVAAAADHQIIYGKQRVGGVVVYKETTDDDSVLHVVIALAGHEVEDIEKIYANDEELTFETSLSSTLAKTTAPEKYAEKTRTEDVYDDEGEVTGTTTIVEREAAIRAAIYKGTDDQDASAELTAASSLWTGDHKMSGIAYIYVRMNFVADSFPNGEPNFTALVKGKKVYNPNTQTTAYSDNVALCLRDYLKADYGMSATDSELDDTSFIAAANVCDETVGLSAGGNETRYRINAAFTTGTAPQEIIDNMVRSMAGSMWYSQGKFRVKAGKYVAPTISLDEDDLRSNVQIATRRSRRENFNAVVGTFRGEETRYFKSDYPKVASQTFVDVDGGEENITNLDLLYTPTSTMAQRIAKILLYRNREQVTVNASFGLRAFQLQVGDVVQLSNTRAGWSNKTFEVIAWKFSPSEDGQLIVELGLQEISAAVYDWNAEEEAFETNNTRLESAFFVPPVGITTSVETRVINEHVVSVLSVNTTVARPTQVDYVVCEYKKTTDTDYIMMGKGELGVFEAIDVENGFYDVRARAVNSFGVKGDYTFNLVQVQGLIDPPDDVEDFSATINGATTTLEWTAVGNLDLSYYRIRHAVETSGATFADATDSFVKVARPATSVTVPARSGTYTIRAFDKLGIPSQNFTSVVVTDAQLENFTNTTTVTEETAFSGTKTGCSVTSNKLRITDPSSAPSEATYVFANEIDTSSVRRVRATGEVRTDRTDDSAGQWDDLNGNIDQLAGLWDDLTANPQEPDTNVVFYIRHTDDDPSSSPTWSDWKQFKSGDFSGRAFQFKIELVSTSDDVTPNISELSAKVEYN